MKSLILHSHEIQALKAGGKVLVVRPINPQPDWDYPEDIFPGYYNPIIVKNGIQQPGPERYGFSNEDQSWPCPLGAPGERRWVKEQIKIKHNDPSMIIHYGTYAADLEPVLSEGVRMKWFWKQKSLTNIPRWASRFTVQVERVEVRKIKSLCLEDSVAAGFVGRFICPSPELCRDIENCNHDSEYHFMLDWNSRYARRGFAFDANPWAWFAWVERVER